MVEVSEFPEEPNENIDEDIDVSDELFDIAMKKRWVKPPFFIPEAPQTIGDELRMITERARADVAAQHRALALHFLGKVRDQLYDAAKNGKSKAIVKLPPYFDPDDKEATTYPWQSTAIALAHDRGLTLVFRSTPAVDIEAVFTWDSKS